MNDGAGDCREVISFIQNFFDYKVDWYQQRQILVGVLLCLVSIAFEGQFCIEDAYNKTKNAVGGVEDSEWMKAVNELDITLFQHTSNMVTDLINMNKEAIRKILVREKVSFYQEQVVGERAKQFLMAS